MPGLSGVDALPAITRVAPSTRVVMVSGQADTTIARRALALGAFDYVFKPVDLNHLSQCVETALAMRALDL